jgi:hypothetical protein
MWGSRGIAPLFLTSAPDGGESYSTIPEIGNSRFLRNIGKPAHNVYTKVKCPCVLSFDIISVFPTNMTILWHIDPLLSFDSVNSGSC